MPEQWTGCTAPQSSQPRAATSSAALRSPEARSLPAVSVRPSAAGAGAPGGLLLALLARAVPQSGPEAAEARVPGTAPDAVTLAACSAAQVRAPSGGGQPLRCMKPWLETDLWSCCCCSDGQACYFQRAHPLSEADLVGARVWQIALTEVQHGAAALPATRSLVRLLAEDAAEGVQDWAAAVLNG